MIRATLINKGIIYSTSYGEIGFTVLQFDEYLKEYQSLVNLECKKVLKVSKRYNESAWCICCMHLAEKKENTKCK
jgi:hypothetical protein